MTSKTPDDNKATLTHRDQETWPSVLRFSAEALPAAEIVAKLALQLWQASGGPAKGKPEDYLSDAVRLLAKTEEAMRQPQDEEEFLREQGGSDEAIMQFLSKRQGEHPQRVTFLEVVNSAKHEGDRNEIRIPLQNNLERVIDWRVYAGKEALRGFERFFWKYADSQSYKWWTEHGEQWGRWVKGEIVPQGFPLLTEKLFNTKERRAAFAAPWIEGKDVPDCRLSSPSIALGKSGSRKRRGGSTVKRYRRDSRLLAKKTRSRKGQK